MMPITNSDIKKAIGFRVDKPIKPEITKTNINDKKTINPGAIP